MKRLLILSLLFFSTLFSENITFKDKLINAKKGDYIVFELNKFYSALCIYYIDKEEIILEEITISKDRFDKNTTFKYWLENGAKKNSSWSIYKIDLKTNKIKDAFSICKNSWIKLTANESIITNLLDIKLTKLQDSQRKKISSNIIWNPPKIVNSKKVKNPNFNAYKSKWPNDSSEFASKLFDIYFTDDFPFPFFIELSNGNLSHIIRAIDSGTNLNSTVKYFPRRKAQIKQIVIDHNTLTIQLLDATVFNEFDLFAIDFSKKGKIIHSLKFHTVKDNDSIILNMDINNLNEILEKKHKYKFVVVPKFQKDIFIESKELITWK